MTLEAKIYESNSMSYTKSLHQHDKNVTLVFTGIDLPEKYEVHFSNDKDGGISVACEGTDTGVLIPDALLSTGAYVYAWVCSVEEDIGTDTLFTVAIPVIPRPIPVVGTSSASEGKIKYSVDEDEENVNFLNSMFNRAINPNIEEET